MENPGQTPTAPAPEQVPESAEVVEARRQQAQADIDKARQNIAEGVQHVSDSHGVVETPSETAAVANGETDANA